MAKKLFVGGIPWATTSDDLQQLFSQHGTVASATVITDKMTGRSRGFGFVEFEKVGRLKIYKTTKKFQDYFGITDLNSMKEKLLVMPTKQANG